MLKVGRFLNRNFFKNLSPHLDHNIYHSRRGLANEAVAPTSSDSNLNRKEEEEDKEITPHTKNDQLESLADYLNLNVDYSSTSKQQQQLKSPAYKKLQSTSQPTASVYENLVNKITTSSSTFSSQIENEESRKFAEKVLLERPNYHEIVNTDSKLKNKLSSHFDLSEYADNEEEIKRYVPPSQFSNKTNNEEDYSNRSKSNKIIESKNQTLKEQR